MAEPRARVGHARINGGVTHQIGFRDSGFLG